MQTEKAAEDELESEIRKYLVQTRMWRLMNSALWIAWGIVQFKYPGMEDDIAAANGGRQPNGEKTGEVEHPKTPPVDADVDEEEDGFDYLAYAQDRAMFFWSDMLALQLIDPEELPTPMVEHLRARMIEY